ncbi:MAG: hypothetical protein KA715_00025 [Xanthomonadaceae bacterium]|nr:hypothetical protein [Xanthomonadaceae bacterium]
MDQPIIKAVQKKKRRNSLLQQRERLADHASELVSGWVKQVKRRNPLIRVTRLELQHWVICQRSPELSEQELDVFCREFSDKFQLIHDLSKKIKECEEDMDAEVLYDRFLKMVGQEINIKNRQRNTKKDDAPSCSDSTKNELKTAVNDKKNHSKNIQNLIEKNQE